MDNLAGFQIFIQAAETGGFAAAGRLLGLSASAVGKSVARLEERLGARLFHRSTRSLALTAEGQLLLARCRRIFAEVEAAEAELSMHGAPRGSLRVSLPLVSTLMLPVLADFMREYPAVQLDLDFSDRLVDVIEEGFDAVVRTGTPRDSRLQARKLGDYRMRMVAAPAYLQKYGQPRRPAELANHRCLHYRFPSSGKLEVWPLRQAPAEPAWQLPISMVCNNIETRVCFALRGLGIAMLPDFAISGELARGRLRPVLDDYLDHGSSFHVLWPTGRHLPPKLRVFVDYLAEKVFAPTVAPTSRRRRTS